MGLEPTTATLATWRSTTELHPLGPILNSLSSQIIKVNCTNSRGSFERERDSAGARERASVRRAPALLRSRALDPRHRLLGEEGPQAFLTLAGQSWRGAGLGGFLDRYGLPRELVQEGLRLGKGFGAGLRQGFRPCQSAIQKLAGIHNLVDQAGANRLGSADHFAGQKQ